MDGWTGRRVDGWTGGGRVDRWTGGPVDRDGDGRGRRECRRTRPRAWRRHVLLGKFHLTGSPPPLPFLVGEIRHDSTACSSRCVGVTGVRRRCRRCWIDPGRRKPGLHPSISGDRLGDSERPAVAKPRPRSRRTVHRDLRREGPAEGRLLRRDRRRPLEDDRRRRALGERHRRADQERVGRRGRRFRDRSEHRFHRHG